MIDLGSLALDARNGDREAMATLVRELQGDVWRFCAHLTTVDEADDLAQESLLRVVSHLRRWERGPVLTWALGVARNVCNDHLRRRHRRRTDPVADPRQAGTVDLSGYVETIHLLSELPVDQREAIVLTQIIGLSYTDAADVLACPVGTVRSRIARGRDSLAETLRTSRRAVAD